jgi:putative toxin-antitoxin system antitoxin component (TIGR02293 family)
MLNANRTHASVATTYKGFILECCTNYWRVGVNNTNKSVVEITLGVAFSRPLELNGRIRQGLSFAALTRLQKQYGLSRSEILTMLAISQSTSRRREAEGRLSVDEGDKILRYARLLDLALELVNGNRENALQWLSTPNRELSGETALSYAQTGVGAEVVRDLIAKIEHGVVI